MGNLIVTPGGSILAAGDGAGIGPWTAPEEAGVYGCVCVCVCECGCAHWMTYVCAVGGGRLRRKGFPVRQGSQVRRKTRARPEARPLGGPRFNRSIILSLGRY